MKLLSSAERKKFRQYTNKAIVFTLSFEYKEQILFDDVLHAEQSFYMMFHLRNELITNEL